MFVIAQPDCTMDNAADQYVPLICHSFAKYFLPSNPDRSLSDLNECPFNITTWFAKKTDYCIQGIQWFRWSVAVCAALNLFNGNVPSSMYCMQVDSRTTHAVTNWYTYNAVAVLTKYFGKLIFIFISSNDSTEKSEKKRKSNKQQKQTW